jgi:hypothetical protein
LGALSKVNRNTRNLPEFESPAPLLKAHQNFDQAVDRFYHKKLETERERVEFLPGLYKALIGPL